MRPVRPNLNRLSKHETANHENERLERINRYLELLKERARSCNSQTSPATDNHGQGAGRPVLDEPAAPIPTEPLRPVAADPVTPQPIDRENSNSEAVDNQGSVLVEEVLGNEAPANDDPQPETNLQPIPLTSTVDSLALANNLFAQGKIDFAAPIYEKLVHLPQAPSELNWIRYQLAACYRRQNKAKEAKKLYRVVASSRDDYWAKRAHWWLDYLGTTETLSDRKLSFENEFKLLAEEIDALRAK